MTASAFAQLLGAKKVGRGKWTAKCPSHPDRNPSLSIAEGKRGVLVRCMSHGCDTKDILAAVGLSYSDLFFDKCSPAVRARTSLSHLKEQLTEQWGSARLLGDLEPQKRNYWRAIQKRAYNDLQLVRCRIEPVEVYREYRGHLWQSMTQKQKDTYLERIADGIHATAESTGSRAK